MYQYTGAFQGHYSGKVLPCLNDNLSDFIKTKHKSKTLGSYLFSTDLLLLRRGELCERVECWGRWFIPIEQNGELTQLLNAYIFMTNMTWIISELLKTKSFNQPFPFTMESTNLKGPAILYLVEPYK